MKTSHLILIVFNALYILGFAVYYVALQNYEFLLYIAVLVVLFALVAGTYRKTRFGIGILWMLSIWGFLHMLGGGIRVGDEVLYRHIVLDIFQGADSEFVILKFDQILHFYIYFVMSFVMFHLLNLTAGKKAGFGIITFFALLASSGVGALNEIIEFGAVVFLGKTGVGGYYNTALDLVFNFLGALCGALAAMRVYRK